MSINTRISRTDTAVRTGIAARLADIKARADKATDGPWRSRDLDDYDEETPDAVEVCGPGPSTIAMTSARDWDSDYDPEMFANAEFIASARTDLPALVNGLESVLDYVGRCEESGITMQPGDVRRLIANALGAGS